MNNNIYELSKNLYNQLMTNHNELNQVAFYNFLNNFSFMAEEKCERLLNGEMNTMGVSHMLNIGSTINYDLLADFLLNLTYIRIPNGPYNRNKDEYRLVNCYNDFQKINLLNTISRFIFIHEMLKIFIMFVRKNYFSTFFSKLDIINQDDKLRESILDFYHDVNLILKPSKLVFNREFKRASQVFEYISQEQIKKADLVSSIIDINYYKEIVISQYRLMIKEIDLYLEFIKYNKPERKVSDLECEIFKNFALSFKEFMNARIEYLDNPFIKIK